MFASVKTLDTLHSSVPGFFFLIMCINKVIIDISSPWLWRECPVNATALIAPFNKACTAGLCCFYVVIKQKSICHFLRFSTCKPSADQMVTIYFCLRQFKSLTLQYDFTLFTRFSPKVLISSALFTAAHFHVPEGSGTLKR